MAKKEKWSEDDIASIIMCILEALTYCHAKKGMALSNLKPSNILFDTEPNSTEKVQLRLTDVGFEKVMKTSSVSHDDEFYFIAPEALNWSGQASDEAQVAPPPNLTPAH